MDIPVTVFRGLRFTSPKEQTTLEKVLNDIKSDKWKDRVLKCHNDIKHKDWLPCFTPTGSFTHRSIKGLEYYNGIICLDIDHVENPSDLKQEVKKLPWVHAAFTTPSSKGLKVIVRTNSTPENYRRTEEKVAAMFRDAVNFVRDNHCKDIARIQFISYDPDLYYNPESEVIEQERMSLEEAYKIAEKNKMTHILEDFLKESPGMATSDIIEDFMLHYNLRS
jgi:hypothetical protein